MGPKVYAYLAARWVCGEIKPEVDVEDLFTDMEEKNGIWDGRGPIPQRIGIPAVREFLEVVEAASQKMLQGIPVSDISFSSEPDT